MSETAEPDPEPTWPEPAEEPAEEPDEPWARDPEEEEP
jgi:hypothetical protein